MKKVWKQSLSDIYYLECINRKISIYEKTGVFTYSSSIKSLREKFENDGFAVPHKSF